MRLIGIVLALAAVNTGVALGQGRGGAQPPKSPKDAAPVDLTGTWVSVVTEDWRWRMVTPLKGDSASVPVNAAARKVIESWDPAKDEAAGLQCKAYGAPAIMRVPGRVRISWQDDSTLKLEADAGTQVRTFHFGGKVPEKVEPSWQGYSVAQWEQPFRPPEASGLGVVRTGNAGRSLEVDTTNLRPGYLRKNGVPYSARATVKEYFERHKEHDGTEWFTVTSIVTDPEYLAVPFVTSSDFRREPNDSKFSPSACTAR
jgi:hypothetical protein